MSTTMENIVLGLHKYDIRIHEIYTSYTNLVGNYFQKGRQHEVMEGSGDGGGMALVSGLFCRANHS